MRRELCIIPVTSDVGGALCCLCDSTIPSNILDSTITYISQVSNSAQLPKYMVSSCKIVRNAAHARFEELRRYGFCKVQC